MAEGKENKVPEVEAQDKEPVKVTQETENNPPETNGVNVEIAVKETRTETSVAFSAKDEFNTADDTIGLLAELETAFYINEADEIDDEVSALEEAGADRQLLEDMYSLLETDMDQEEIPDTGEFAEYGQESDEYISSDTDQSGSAVGLLETEHITVEDIKGQLEVHMQSLDEEKATEVKEIIYEILEVVSRIPQPVESASETNSGIVAEVEALEELNELCVQLFERLEIEYDQDVLRQFIDNLIFGDDEGASVTDELLQDMRDQGTHEHLLSSHVLVSIRQLIAQKLPLRQMLGKLILRFSTS